MAGKTGLMIGFINGQFIHVPFELSINNVKRLDLDGELWYAVLSTTKQPPSFRP